MAIIEHGQGARDPINNQPLRTLVLPDGCTLRLGRLRRDLIIRGEEFADLWGLHPVELRRPVQPTLRSPQASSSER
jgi:hypothetical protein